MTPPPAQLSPCLRSVSSARSVGRICAIRIEKRGVRARAAIVGAVARRDFRTIIIAVKWSAAEIATSVTTAATASADEQYLGAVGHCYGGNCARGPTRYRGPGRNHSSQKWKNSHDDLHWSTEIGDSRTPTISVQRSSYLSKLAGLVLSMSAVI